jgi:hypothetical protein
MTAGLVGTSGFAAIPTTALDLPRVQRLRRSPRFRVRVPIEIVARIAASPVGGAEKKGNKLHSNGNLLHAPRSAKNDAGHLVADGWRGNGRRAPEPKQTIRVGAWVAFAKVRIAGFDGQIELQALRPAKGRAGGALRLEPTSGELVFDGISLPVLGARANHGQAGP